MHTTLTKFFFLMYKQKDGGIIIFMHSLVKSVFNKIFNIGGKKKKKKTSRGKDVLRGPLGVSESESEGVIFPPQHAEHTLF